MNGTGGGSGAATGANGGTASGGTSASSGGTTQTGSGGEPSGSGGASTGGADPGTGGAESGGADAGTPASTAFVMGAENKDGTQDELSSALQCELNLLQRSTGWCSTWNGWEQNGCNVLSGAAAFYAASEKHGIELSLTPWPESLSGQSFGACARGDYDAHYTTFAQALVNAGIRHVTLRLAYEWDGSWFSWGTGLHETGDVNNAGPGGSALEYAACFKRFDADVQAVARAASAPVHFRMVMNPIHDTFGTKGTQLQQVFDAAGGARAAGGSVDVLGVDIYDYPSRNDFDSRMLASIAFAKKNGVPLSIPEWGVGGDSRTEPAVDDAGEIYVQKMAGYLGDPSNGIPYASYFNCAKPECAGLHSLIPPNNPKSNAAFVAAFGNGKLGCGANARAMIEAL